VKLNDAWAVRGITGWTKMVFVYLAWRQHEQNYAEVSIGRIAADLGTAGSTVCRALAELDRSKLVSRASSGGRTVTRYTVNCSAAQQLTVAPGNTKDIRPREGSANATVGGKRQLDMARAAIRRKQVRETFLALCEMYEPEVIITVSMLARELGARPSQTRTDMQYLIKHRDVPFDILPRFGNAKPNHKRIAQLKAAKAAAEQENVVLFARGSR
jgi:hypothetical protein